MSDMVRVEDRVRGEQGGRRIGCTIGKQPFLGVADTVDVGRPSGRLGKPCVLAPATHH